jgi:hypothetical protein
VNLPVSSPKVVASIRSLNETQPGYLPLPAQAALHLTVGIVLFNNTAEELQDLARTLQRAIARLEQSEANANPPLAAKVAVYLHNNGDTPAHSGAFGPDAQLMNASGNLGYGRAHNLLMREAFAKATDAEFYLAVNPDGMFHPDTLVEIIAAARRFGGRALVEAAQFPEELPKSFDPLTLDTPWASGCCLLIPATVHAAIGDFDENMFLFCEDVDLSWRARQAGLGVKHAPLALFHHRYNRPGSDYAKQRVHLAAARYLAVKWGGEDFVRDVERQMAGQVGEPNPVPADMASPSVSAIPDFSHGLSFAPARWTCPSPIPVHSVVRRPDIDATIDVIIRFHDPGQIKRLSRCIFSLYGQSHQPIQIILMLQHLDQEGAAAVRACIDAFDWSAPRRPPIVKNVNMPRPGDHRARLWNAGLEAGRARYIAFLDFDDTMYSAGYRYLLHRLQHTGAAAAFASALQTDCTPMHGFDFIFGKRRLIGADRYDFFISGFCPGSTVLIDRGVVNTADLRADESLSKAEDYLVFATLAAKYDTDWENIGTVISDYYVRSDGSNTILSHRSDAAARRGWQESLEKVARALAAMTTKVPVKDIVHMRGTERELRHRIAELEAGVAQEHGERARMKSSLSWRLTRPVRELQRWVRRLRKR